MSPLEANSMLKEGLSEGFIKVDIKGMHYSYLGNPRLGRNIAFSPFITKAKCKQLIAHNRNTIIVCVCVCVCRCVFVCVYVHIHVCLGACVCACVSMSTHTCGQCGHPQMLLVRHWQLYHTSVSIWLSLGASVGSIS